MRLTTDQHEGLSAGWARNPLLRRALLGTALVYFAWNCLYYTPYVVDDAFISLRYARNLVAGQGLVYNPGQRVEGFSNFLWTLLEAGLLACGLPVLAGIKTLGLASGLALVALTYRLGRLLFPARPAVALLATVMLCLNTSLAVWTQAGLETAFFAALIVAMCLRFELEQRELSARPLSALVFGLLWLTRPEAPAYGLYFVARRFLGRERRPLGRRDLRWLGTLAVLVGAYELWGLWYYGALFPNTHAAKVGGKLHLLELVSAERLESSQLFHFVVHQGWGFALLLGLGTLGVLRRARALPAAVWTPVVSGVVFLLYAWGDWMPRFRFVVPILPSLFLGLAWGLIELGQALGRRPALRLTYALVSALALLGYAQDQMFGPYYRNRARSGYEFATEGRGFWFLEALDFRRPTLYPMSGGTWRILERTTKSELVAIADIGLPGYVSMNPIWDLRGLVTPVAASARRGGELAVRAAVDDLLAQRPALIEFPPLHQWLELFEQVLREDPRTQRDYRRLASPDGKDVRYERLDLPARIPRTRVLRALEGFPEYDSEYAQAYR